jgi:predicted nucleic acid-binding protein
MALLIDSSVLLEAERGRLDVSRRIAARGSESMFVSVITASELLHAAQRATTTQARLKRTAFVEAVLERFAIVELDLATVRAQAQIAAWLASSEVWVTPSDTWLAATCVAHGLTLVAAQEREFARIPGLDFLNWGIG